MGMWAIEGTDKVSDGTSHGWMNLNATRNREKELKHKKIVFIDDDGTIHHDINNLHDAVNAGFIEGKTIGWAEASRTDRPPMVTGVTRPPQRVIIRVHGDMGSLMLTGTYTTL